MATIFNPFFLNLVMLVGICLATGCNQRQGTDAQLLHPMLRPAQRLLPERYFTDPAVIDLCTAIQNRQVASIAAMLDRGVDVNALGKDGMTPLLWAVLTSDVDIFRLLIQ